MENDKDKTEVEAEVRFILSFHKGKEHAISRWELVEKIFGREAAADRGNNNKFDRQIRSVIEKYREVDLIVSSSGSVGYWLAADMEDIMIIANEFEERSKKMLAKRSKIMKRGMERFGGQMKLV